jgi:hypothetical protein
VAKSCWKNPRPLVKRKRIMNLFWPAVRNVTARWRLGICAQIQNLAACHKTRCMVSRTRRCFPRHPLQIFPLREMGHDVSLERSRRFRLFRPARFKDRGGRANRRRCARWRRFPSDCQVQTHSNMSNVVLCRNFSGEAFMSRSLRTREIRNGNRAGKRSRRAGINERANKAA